MIRRARSSVALPSARWPPAGGDDGFQPHPPSPPADASDALEDFSTKPPVHEIFVLSEILPAEARTPPRRRLEGGAPKRAALHLVRPAHA
jgi:hypothetical protein